MRHLNNMSACATVLDTYELLENILLDLSLPDILLAERVSKAFQSLIWRSMKIAVVLFRLAFRIDVVVQQTISRVPSTNPGSNHDYRDAW